MTNTQKFTFKLQIVALILMAAGWGWADGNFSSGLPLWNVLLHCIPILLLLIIGLQIFRVRDTSQGAESHARGAEIGMTVFTVVTIISTTVLVILGVSNSDPNSVGVHNLWDWFPTILLYMSALLWLATLIPTRRVQAVVNTATIE
ncbi:hypothetical protein ccbrp13_32160 [Ktedonobacteria bacterium brp13]|nr:hypothetical protein ccbrp13_32160 [Ktedonobacteria bacterium brp13]